MCPTREATLAALRERPEFAGKRAEFDACSRPEALEDRFLSVLDELTGAHDPLDFGHGRWLERLRGKAVMPTVVARCFRVRNAADEPVQGWRAALELARELLRRPLADQPDDLQELRKVIHTRVRGASVGVPEGS